MTLFDTDTEVRKDALISECGRYRYLLTRDWSAKTKPACFIMLNPSTADATQDDPTIRRCIGFARGWDCGGIMVVNLFAFRATDPAEVVAASIDGIDPIGPENDETIRHVIDQCRPVVCAWGSRGDFLGRADQVLAILKHSFREYRCLGTTKHGHPRHPLYVRGDAVLTDLAASGGIVGAP